MDQAAGCHFEVSCCSPTRSRQVPPAARAEEFMLAGLVGGAVGVGKTFFIWDLSCFLGSRASWLPNWVRQREESTVFSIILLPTPATHGELTSSGFSCVLGDWSWLGMLEKWRRQTLCETSALKAVMMVIMNICGKQHGRQHCCLVLALNQSSCVVFWRRRNAHRRKPHESQAR